MKETFGTWYPIDTAPTDGTWVLLKGGEALDRYDQSEAGTHNPMVVAFCRVDWFGDRVWTYAYWDSAWRSSYENPTHWTPLPEL